MYLSSIKNKIDCCFAKSVYNKYLHNRYGINNCKDEDETTDLNILQKAYNYYYSSILQPDRDINPSYNKVVHGDCNTAKLIEKINLL